MEGEGASSHCLTTVVVQEWSQNWLLTLALESCSIVATTLTSAMTSTFGTVFPGGKGEQDWTQLEGDAVRHTAGRG